MSLFRLYPKIKSNFLFPSINQLYNTIAEIILFQTSSFPIATETKTGAQNKTALYPPWHVADWSPCGKQYVVLGYPLAIIPVIQSTILRTVSMTHSRFCSVCQMFDRIWFYLKFITFEADKIWIMLYHICIVGNLWLHWLIYC